VRTSPTFEQSRRLITAALLLAACLLVAYWALWWADRRWLIAAGSAGLYLLGMDVFYDLAHRICATSSGGVIELIIDTLVACASVTVLIWSWHNRTDLLTQPCALRDPHAARAGSSRS